MRISQRVRLAISVDNLKGSSHELDRALQLQILNFLSDHYAKLPEQVFPDREMSDEEDDKYMTNLLYLEEHDLIHAGLQQALGGEWISSGAKITARGLDFLANDGGLTAILGVVNETIRDLIEARIQDSDLPPDEKTGLLHQLKELRGESIKHLTMKLLDAGLENLPAALPLIQKALGGLI